jgi:hypothetical protein
MRRETDRPRVLLNVVKAQGLAFIDDDSEHARPPWQRAYLPDQLFGNTRMHEREEPAFFVDRPHCGVLRTYNLSREVCNALEQSREVELGGESKPGVDQGLNPLVGADSRGNAHKFRRLRMLS